MATGLIALLDDVAAISKLAAASLDDVGAATLKASSKAAGVVIDDAAVTPRYVVGFAAARELPIVGKIALGSLKNKLLILLPAALALSEFAPWVITPLLMLGGLYLCYEGAEKLWEKVSGHAQDPGAETIAGDPAELERAKISGAIQTDFILSAEIMAIALATIEAPDVLSRALVLGAVAVAITAGVYGVVALIVKADDAGVSLARAGRPALLRTLGRLLVNGMPRLLAVLAAIGTAAMLWVGGGIIVHGAAELGWSAPEHAIEHTAHLAGALLPAAKEVVMWLVRALLSGLLGVALGAAVVAALAVLRPARVHA